MMQTIDQELVRLSAAMNDAPSPDRYAQLYAAQQALSWAKFPEGFMSPFDTIMNGKVMPPIPDTPTDSPAD